MHSFTFDNKTYKWDDLKPMHRGQMACFFYLINENRPEYEDEDVDRLSFSAATVNADADTATAA